MVLIINNKKNETQTTGVTEEKQNIVNEPIEEFISLEELSKKSNEINEKNNETKTTQKEVIIEKNTNNKTTAAKKNINKYYIKVNYNA